VRPSPVWTSSATSTAPAALAAERTALANAGGAGCTPPSPWTGSTRIAAGGRIPLCVSVSAQRSARAELGAALAACPERAAVGGREREVLDVGAERAERGLRRVPAGQRERALRHPVVRAAERDRAAAAGRGPGELDGSLDGVGTGRPAELDPPAAQPRRQHLEERLDELVAQRRREVERRQRDAAVECRPQRRDDRRVTVAERERSGAGEAVEVRAAGGVADDHALAVGEHDRQAARVGPGRRLAAVLASQQQVAGGRVSGGRRHRHRRQPYLKNCIRST
jgi:hypothetical protein